MLITSEGRQEEAVGCDEGLDDTEGSSETVGICDGDADTEGFTEMVGFDDGDGDVLGWMLTSRRLTILTQVVVPSRIAWTSTGRPLLPLSFSKPMVTVPRSWVKPLYRNSMDPSTNERTA